MTDVVDYLRNDYAPSLRKLQDPVLGRPTLNVGKITGGAQVNIVPDHCEMLVDHRTLPEVQSHPAIYQKLTRELRRRGVPAQIERYRDCPPLGTNPRLPLVQQFHRCVRSVAPASKLAGVSYFTDASIFAKHGSPAVVFGPGSIAQAHTKDEWIDLSHLSPASEVCYRFLQTQVSAR